MSRAFFQILLNNIGKQDSRWIDILTALVTFQHSGGHARQFRPGWDSDDLTADPVQNENVSGVGPFPSTRPNLVLVRKSILRTALLMIRTDRAALGAWVTFRLHTSPAYRIENIHQSLNNTTSDRT